MTFKISDFRTINERTKNHDKCNWEYIKAILIIMPTILLMMLVFDIFSMLINFISYFIMLIAMLTPFRLKVYEKNEEF
jgi:hypothetical protein